MKIHFFQRYHSKENVDTANAMLLLSRLYTFSSTEFFSFLGKVLPENASVEMLFILQERNSGSVPDATITQASFKVVVETKLYPSAESISSHNYLAASYRFRNNVKPKIVFFQN